MKDGDYRVRGKEISRVEGLSDTLFGRRMRRSAILAVVVAIGCGKGGGEKQSTPATVVPTDSATAPAVTAATGCPPDGKWHECSAIQRLDRSGLAPRRDSVPATEKALSQPGVLIHLGDAELELFFYPDEAARVADEKKLDSKEFIDASVPLSIQRERTLIRSVNLLGLLKSLREHQRERVSDALTAGPPQPPT